MRYTVNPITYEEARPWILNIHYAKRIPCISHAFGLFDEDNYLSGVCSFGAPATPFLCIGVCGEEYKHLVLELNRLVIREGMPKNSASYFISRSIKLLPKPRILVSYADNAMEHIGYIYQATNWIYTGATKERTDMAAGDGKHPRHYVPQTQQRVKRSSKHRYVYFHGCDKAIRNAFRYSNLPYPKGRTGRYVTDLSKIHVTGTLF